MLRRPPMLKRKIRVGTMLIPFLLLCISSTCLGSITPVHIQGDLPGTGISPETVTSKPKAYPSGKRGLAYNSPALTKLFTNPNGKLSWMYNWGQFTSGANANLEFFPMLWSLDPGLTSTWNTSVYNALSAGTTHLLSFNEPEVTSQSNITPKAAAAGYMKYMQPYASLAKLGGPAISAGGLDWLDQFYGNCTNCHIDFQPVHWYDYAWNLGWFNSYLTQAHAIAGRSIWLTEFEGWGNDTEQIVFFKNVSAWMDSTAWIGGYAYFGVFNGSLVTIPSGGGKAVLSDIGVPYNRYNP